MKKKMISLLTAFVLCLGLLPATAFAQSPVYLALGDSITTGYRLEAGEESFAEQVAKKGYTLVNEAADGERADTLLNKIKTGSVDVTNADLITITIGGNDLMKGLYQYLADEWTADHPDDPKGEQDIQAMLTSNSTSLLSLMPLVEYLPGFANSTQARAALVNFSTCLTEIASLIKAKNPDVTLLVTTQYNPYSYMGKLYSTHIPQAATIAGAFDQGASAINNAIGLASGGGAAFTVVDVYTAFVNAETAGVNLCNPSVNVNTMTADLDFHPNAAGHSLIAETVLAVLNTGGSASGDAGLASVTVQRQKAAINGSSVTVKLPCDMKISADAADITIVPADPQAEVSVPVTADGGKTWTFTVIAEDGVTQAEYTIQAAVSAHTLITTDAKEATCTEEGYTGDIVCAVCGTVIEKGESMAKTAHQYKDGQCTACGKTDPSDEPEKQDQDMDSPKTGDANNLVPWIALLLLSGTGLTATAACCRKRGVKTK